MSNARLAAAELRAQVREQLARRGEEPWASLLREAEAALEGAQGDDLEALLRSLSRDQRRALRRWLNAAMFGVGAPSDAYVRARYLGERV